MCSKVVHIISSLEIGGAQAVLYDIIRYVPAIEHHVIYFHDDAWVARLRECGVKVYNIPYAPLFFIRIVCLIRKLQPDYVHTSLWAANVCGRLLSRLLTIPVACVVHNQAQYHGVLRSCIDDVTLSGSYQLVAVSSQVKQSLITRHPQLQNKKITVITNGVDVDRVVHCARQAHITRADVGLDDQSFIFGTVGRFEAIKNFDLLIACFAKLVYQYPHARLLFVGSGRHQRLAHYTHRLGVEKQVIFITGQQAYGYYPLFDCFVQPSGSEGVSIALLEAMSIGLPCLVTGNGMKHPVVEHLHNGYIIEPHDAQQLQYALEKCLINGRLRAALAKKAYETVRAKWSAHRMVDEYACHFKATENTK